MDYILQQEDIRLLEALELAYYDCRKHKRHTCNAIDFEVNWEQNLYSLFLDIKNRTYKIGRSISFVLLKGVKSPREIFAATFRDRVIQHYLVNKLLPYFNNYFIYRRFSSRKGFGTLDSTHLIQKDIINLTNNYLSDCWLAKVDIKAFFTSINRKILWSRLKSFIKSNYYEWDRDIILYLTKLVTLNDPTQGCIRKTPKSWWNLIPSHKSLFNSGKNKGLAIGNVTSQIFASFYLTPLDKLIDKNFPQHISWVDDIEISDISKSKVLGFIDIIRQELSKVRLSLNESKFYLQHYSKGIKFAGSVIKPGRTYCTKRVLTNFIRKIYGFNRMVKRYPVIKLLKSFISGINSYLGIMSHHSSYGLRRKTLKSLSSIWFKFFCICGGFKKLYVYKRYRVYYQTIPKKHYYKIYGY